nr:uncharacterized protein LOC107277379 [Oryza sativa Japonica Group]
MHANTRTMESKHNQPANHKGDLPATSSPAPTPQLARRRLIMGEAQAPAAASFSLAQRRGGGLRLPRRVGRRKVHVVRLGGGCSSARTGGGGRGLCLRRLRLRWLRRAVWRLAELCVAALSGPLGAGAAAAATDATSPWGGGAAVAVDPYAFAAPFVPAVLLKRAGKGY